MQNKFTKLHGTYNRALYWPDGIDYVVDHVLGDEYAILASLHAKDRIKEKHLPEFVYKSCLYGEIVEATFTEGHLDKIVTRLHDRRDNHNDICFAIIFKHGVNRPLALVKTVWCNNEDDDHATLNWSQYVNM
jgi:hypothetical protein